MIQNDTVMSLVKVWTEVDDGKCQSLPAKIVSKTGSVFKIRYLSVTEDRDSKNRKIYRYEDDTYEVTDESITEYLDSDSELDLGFQEIGNGNFIKCDYDLGFSSEDEDEDYIPSSEDDDDSDEEDEDDASLDDEIENFEIDDDD